MVKLLAGLKGNGILGTFLPQLEREYKFWMRGADELSELNSRRYHTVRMEGGEVLNRYWDANETPRPESLREDVELSMRSEQEPALLYRHVRAGAESGWDFSSRWLKDGQSLESIQTTDIIPVDLNCLLYHLECMLASGYEMKKDKAQFSFYKKKASERRRGILTFFWNNDLNFFVDYNFRESRQSNTKTMAGVYPLFFQLAQPNIAIKIAQVLQKDFLKPGGLTTTLNETGQQWDAPNGWAPLQWIGYKGLKNYQIDQVANEVKKRWLKSNYRVYKATHKMMEKYNVMDTTLLAGGGEYPNQDGFGWTNGVALALLSEK